MHETKQGPLMGTKEAALIIGCSQKHVCELCERGEVKAVRLGRCWHVNRAALVEQLGLSTEEVTMNA